MKLADFFVQLGVVGDTKELDKTINQMEKLNKRNKEILKYRQDLAKATSESEKALIKKNFADKVRIDNLKKSEGAIKANIAAFKGAAAGITAFIGVAITAYTVIDRMASAFAQANQKMITFQRTTGISFSSLNKYASASASVNYNATIEGTAQSMQRVAQNLWDIRMGRGDISPYQELAYVGGRAFNPMGMSVEQVIENVREAIKGVDDLQATNIITRMGFSPDDLLMLRMSRKEFEQINNLFLSPEQREAMNLYALNLKKIQLEYQKITDLAVLDIAEPFIQLSQFILNCYKGIVNFTKGWIKLQKLVYNFSGIKHLVDLIKAIPKIIDNIIQGTKSFIQGLIETHEKLKPILSILKIIAETIFLPIEDFVGYLTGKDSLIGRALEGLSKIDLFGNWKEQFESSEIKEFFNIIKEGMETLKNLDVPLWLIGLLTNNWVAGAAGLILEINKLVEKLNPQVSENLEDNKIASNPIYTPSTNNINTANTVNNNNTQMDVSIATNQPIGNVLNNLQNTYGFTQASYAGIPV